MAPMTDDPLLGAKDYAESSVFRPENLLREARRQRGLPNIPVPPVCLLDPDGDIVSHLESTGRAARHPGWACYHTTLWTFDLNGTEVGVVGCAVGASFAVLVAEQLAASGCELLISITSAGRVCDIGEPPYFVVIDRALRDEGTSHHYLPPGMWSHASRTLLTGLSADAFDDVGQPVLTGAAWTTDAPYRETAGAISSAEALGILAVEMEAAGLYAYATTRRRDVICVAHVTNTMAVGGDDFEKGDAAGTGDALAVASAIVSRLRPPY